MNSVTLEIILDLLFVVVIATGFLVGMWRGVRKSSLNFGLTFAGVFLSFFLTRPITEAILNIKTSLSGKPCTFGNYLYELILQNGPAAPFVSTNENLATVVKKIPFAISSCVVFLLLSVISSILAYVIYRVIASLVLNKKKQKDSNIKGNRIWGGVIGFAKTFIIALFAIMPATALVNVASKAFQPEAIYISDKDYKPQSILQGIVPNQVGEMVKGLDRSAFCVLGSMFGLNNATFDYLSSFKVEDSTIFIRYELNNYLDVCSAGSELKDIFQGESTFPLSEFNFKRLNASAEKLVDGPLFKYALSKTIGTVIRDYKYYTYIDFDSLGEYKAVIEKLSKEFQFKNYDFSQYFSDDFRKILSTFENIAKTKALDKITDNSFAEIIKQLANEHRDVLESSIKEMLSTNILRDSAEAFVDIGLKSLLNEKISSKISWEKLNEEGETKLTSSVVDIICLYADMPNEDILSIINNPLILTSKDKNFDSETIIKVGKMIDLLRGVDIITNNHNEQIFDSILQKYNMDILTAPQTVYDLNGEEKQIANYEDLMRFIAPSLDIVRNFELYDTLKDPDVTSAKVLKKFSSILEKDSHALEKMILPLQQVSFTNERLMKGMLNNLDTKFVDFSLLESYQDWEKDIKCISDMLLALSEKSSGESLLDSLFYKSTEEFLKTLSSDDAQKVFEPTFNAKSTKNLKEKLLSVVENFTTQLTGKQVQIDYKQQTTEQSRQISDVFAKFLSIYQSYEEGDQISSLNKRQLGELLNSLKINTYSGETESVFGDVFIALVEAVKKEYPTIQLGDDYKDVDFVQILTSLEN